MAAERACGYGLGAVQVVVSGHERVDVGDGLVADRGEAAVGFRVDEVAVDALRAGVARGVRGVCGLEGDLDPVLAAVGAVDLCAFLGGEDAAAGEGRVAEL